MYAKLLHPCQTLFNPMDCSLPGSSVHGILQARILERVAFPFTGDIPDPGMEPAFLISFVSYIGRGFSITSATWEAPVFAVALFAIAKTWKQPKCPSTEKWIEKM